MFIVYIYSILMYLIEVDFCKSRIMYNLFLNFSFCLGNTFRGVYIFQIDFNLVRKFEKY